MPRRTITKEKREKRKEQIEVPVVKRRGRPRKNSVIEAVTEEPIELSVKEPRDEKPRAVVIKTYSQEELMVEGKRKKIMWASVALVMVLVLFVWTVNLKKIVGVDASGPKAQLIKLEDFKNNISKGFRSISTGVTDIKKEITSTTTAVVEVESNSSSTYDTNIVEINKELNVMMNNASSSINNK